MKIKECMLSLWIFIVIFAVLFIGCSEDDKSVKIDENITLQLVPSSFTLTVGEEATLSVIVLPENISYDSMVWDSDNSTVALVNDAGIVRALSEGTANISVKLKGKTSYSTVKVIRKANPDTKPIPDGLLIIEGTSAYIDLDKISDNADVNRAVEQADKVGVISYFFRGNLGERQVGFRRFFKKFSTSAFCNTKVEEIDFSHVTGWQKVCLDERSKIESIGVGLPEYWFDFQTSIGGDDGFCPNLRKVILPDIIEAIGMEAFKGCPALEQVTMNGVKELGYGAFRGCSKLLSITTFNVEKMHQYVFAYCSSLLSLDLPKAINVPASAFIDCKKLSTISLPRVLSIGSSAFTGCNALVTLDLPKVESVAEFGITPYTLKNVNLPSVVKLDFRSIGNFSGAILKLTTASDIDAFNEFEPNYKYIKTPFTEMPTEQNTIYLNQNKRIGGIGKPTVSNLAGKVTWVSEKWGKIIYVDDSGNVVN